MKLASALLGYVRSVLFLGLLLFFLVGHPSAGEKTGKNSEDAKKLQGTWKIVHFETGGKTPVDAKTGKALGFGRKVVIDAKEIKGLRSEKSTFGYRLDASKSPKEIDLLTTASPGSTEEAILPGLYSLEGTKLKICCTFPTKFTKETMRPSKLATEPKQPHSLYILEREKP